MWETGWLPNEIHQISPLLTCPPLKGIEMHRILSSVLSTCLVGSFPLMVSCGKSGQTESKSIIEPAAKWNSTQLRVCFETVNPLAKSHQELVQKALEREFSPTRTGIHFVGFQTCTLREPLHTVRVDASPDKNNPVSMGYSTIKSVNSSRDLGFGMGNSKQISVGDQTGFVKLSTGEIAFPRVTLALDGYCDREGAKVDLINCVQGVALHEFGHVAGLRHEHARPEAVTDPLCLAAKSVDVHSSEREALGATARVGSRPYDPQSIMSYCYMDAYELGAIQIQQVGLSLGDVKTLQSLYLKR
jgi:hypothetical protein